MQSGTPSFTFSKNSDEATIARGGGALFIIDGVSPADGKTSYSLEAMTVLEPDTVPDATIADVSVIGKSDESAESFRMLHLLVLVQAPTGTCPASTTEWRRRSTLKTRRAAISTTA